MKKSLLFFTLLSFAFMGVYAQTPYWNTTGNALTNTTQFIGTTDNNPLIFKTNTTERMRLLPDKPFFGIGTSNPQATLHLYYQDNGFVPTISQKLLQLTTPTSLNGFSIISDLTTKAITFKQQESAKFFIEGQNGGFMIAPTGNIGFGTETPEEKLHLQGTLLIDNTTSTPSSLILRNFSTSTNYQFLPSSNGLKFITLQGSGPVFAESLNMVISNTGKVGIGVASPQESLHIGENFLAEGNITAEGNVIAKDKLVLGNNTGPRVDKWEISRTTTGLNYAYYNSLQTKNVLFLSNDGKIGIGNTAPTTALDVTGTATVTELNADKVTIAGIDLIAQNETLLKKMDVLSLHIIDLQKQIDELKRK